MKKVKIHYDLHQSTYIFKYRNLSFFFSSMFYYNKFKKFYDNYIPYVGKLIEEKTEIHVNTKTIDLINYYNKTEKRGFLIISDKGYKFNKMDDFNSYIGMNYYE